MTKRGSERWLVVGRGRFSKEKETVDENGVVEAMKVARETETETETERAREIWWQIKRNHKSIPHRGST